MPHPRVRCEGEEDDGNAVLSKAAFDGLQYLSVPNAPRIISLDLHSRSLLKENLDLYFRICQAAQGLSVTTSCFTVWKDAKRANRTAKVIPAVRVGGAAEVCSSPCRCFFFDDNVQFEGQESSTGICNLRDVETGEFVAFAEGVNGFVSECVGRHTVIHYSSQYRNVIVKANILDAMEDRDYFFRIVQKHTQPNEKIMVFMDVNSTIMCNDTSAEKDVGATLMSVMFELIQVKVKPSEPLTFQWAQGNEVQIEKPKSLKELVKDVTNYDKAAYSAFWEVDTCASFIEKLKLSAEVAWASRAGPVSGDSFRTMYQQYLGKVNADLLQDGITSSWFSFYSTISADRRNLVVLNSFGVDTRKVIIATGLDEKEIVQVAVNYELWGERDTSKFEAQFRNAEPVDPQQVRLVQDVPAAPAKPDPGSLTLWQRILSAIQFAYCCCR